MSFTNKNDERSNKNILVTGGSGFIGTCFVDYLSKEGYNVTILDVDLPKTNHMNANCKIIVGDIRDWDTVDSIVSSGDFSGIVHLASVSRVIDAENDPDTCISTGITGTENVLSAAKKYTLPWVIFGSSREVYGEQEKFPVNESAFLDPINIYAECKVKAEEMVTNYSAETGSPSIILRFSNVYGKWFDFETRVIPLFLRSIMSGKKIYINGGNQLFDFTYVEDVARGIVSTVKYLENGAVKGTECLHFTGGKPYSLQELVSLIEGTTGNEADIIYNEPRSYDVVHFWGNPEKANRTVGFEASTELIDGIKKLTHNIKNKPLRILKVIHGFPPYYMAGSEVYSFQLVNGLKKHGLDVAVFTRIENPFAPAGEEFYSVENGVLIKRVNNPRSEYTLEDKYLGFEIDKSFERFLTEFQPDIVHIGHLSHLSTDIISIVKKQDIPIVFTIHDFWMFCFRGQMINYLGQICPEPNIKNCMECLRDRLKNHAFEEDFIKYRKHMDIILKEIDVFIAPSEHVAGFYRDMGIDSEKIKHMRYGFDLSRLHFEKKVYTPDSNIRFAFTGRIIPVKGIQTIISAFSEVISDSATLSFYGDAGKYEKYLDSGDSRLYFKGPYPLQDIDSILKEIDVLVVPSEWYEVSPLVIQEALLSGVPVITSELGGMSELVRDNETGFKIEPGDTKTLTEIMQRIVDEPEVLNSLKSDRESVVGMDEHVEKMIEIYRTLV